MRRTSTLSVPVSRGWHDHTCWFHTGPRNWRDVLVPFFEEGVVHRESLFYVSDKTPEELAEDLKELPGRDELLRTGQLTLMSVGLARGMAGDQRLAEQMDVIRRETDHALAAGYPRLRIAAESAHPIQGRADAVQFVRSELLVDEMVSRMPVVLLCGYDGRYVDRRAAAALSFVHPLRQRSTFGSGSGLYADPNQPDTWRLHGELDLASREVFEIALDALPVHGDLHLKLDGLDFIDVGGAHALAALAERIFPRRLILHDPPTGLMRIVELSRDEFPSMRRVVASS
ncbi:MEDS domain-containing protein [Saccharomonospora glauca]|uniref:STAS domain-containing protein n=1 Tax=Saccharomonospora glauca K62 TaxID=928724 RepID=I1D3J7_9PSEU|nr:MEDS domain-containing protein [Saccharomonospora glauca]EIE99521.1 hypothetical protein SacglDRAFT_02629 [Saccharomonospora glauca K62]